MQFALDDGEEIHARQFLDEALFARIEPQGDRVAACHCRVGCAQRRRIVCRRLRGSHAAHSRAHIDTLEGNAHRAHGIALHGVCDEGEAKAVGIAQQIAILDAVQEWPQVERASRFARDKGATGAGDRVNGFKKETLGDRRHGKPLSRALEALPIFPRTKEVGPGTADAVGLQTLEHKLRVLQRAGTGENFNRAERLEGPASPNAVRPFGCEHERGRHEPETEPLRKREILQRRGNPRRNVIRRHFSFLDKSRCPRASPAVADRRRRRQECPRAPAPGAEDATGLRALHPPGR